MPIDWIILGAAALSGLMGGAHCAAMCGGIATGFSAMGPVAGWRQAIEPNLGRVLGYVAAGAIAGGLGHGIVGVADNEWFALALRAAAGLILLAVAVRLLDGRQRFAQLRAPAAALWRGLRPLQRRLLPANTATRRMALGMMWGWMPCGLSTTLLVAAWLQADVRNGALTMAAFGLGTLPVMLPLTWSGARLHRFLQRGGWKNASGTLVLLAGLVTLTSPWLMQVPALHGPLALLGCRSLPG